MATKQKKREAKGLIEGLEFRVHAGPPIRCNEIAAAHEFLRQHDFSPSSDYFNRLQQIQNRLGTRNGESPPKAKRNYGGESAGCWMQVQSAYDHVILSTCYEGEFNLRQGRIKISHRLNQEGRIDFVELKFLRSLQPCLNGELRKLITVNGYQALRKDWREAEAFVLEILPRELIFLCEEIFRFPRHEVLAWLMNIGHRIVNDLLQDLRTRPINGFPVNLSSDSNQLCLGALRTDEVALPILSKAASLESMVEIVDGKNVVVRYLTR